MHACIENALKSRRFNTLEMTSLHTEKLKHNNYVLKQQKPPSLLAMLCIGKTCMQSTCMLLLLWAVCMSPWQLRAWSHCVKLNWFYILCNFTAIYNYYKQTCMVWLTKVQTRFIFHCLFKYFLRSHEFVVINAWRHWAMLISRISQKRNWNCHAHFKNFTSSVYTLQTVWTSQKACRYSSYNKTVQTSSNITLAFLSFFFLTVWQDSLFNKTVFLQFTVWQDSFLTVCRTSLTRQTSPVECKASNVICNCNIMVSNMHYVQQGVCMHLSSLIFLRVSACTNSSNPWLTWSTS